jgi:hypothetical protein
MIIHLTGSLEVSIHDCRSYKFHTQFFEIFAYFGGKISMRWGCFIVYDFIINDFAVSI